MLAIDGIADEVTEVGWVVDYLADLESDLSVFHRVDDMWSMPGPRFFRLAKRTVAYQGVMQARAQGLIDAEGTAPAGVVPSSGRGSGIREIDATPEAVASTPDLAGLIDWGRG